MSLHPIYYSIFPKRIIMGEIAVTHSFVKAFTLLKLTQEGA